MIRRQTFMHVMALTVLCFMYGCNRSEPSYEVSRISFGKINSIVVLEGALTRSKGIVVYCTSGVVVIPRSRKEFIPVIPFQTKCSVAEMTDGKKYFTWSGSRTMYRCE